MHMPALRSRIAPFIAALVLVAASMAAAAAQSRTGLPLPPGDVVTGPVFRAPNSCQPTSIFPISNGAEANFYILPPSCTAVPSFIANAPAAMVMTSEPTQYVRFYCPTCTPSSAPNRAFMADPSTVRGLTPAQIQDVLALPAVPTMETIVLVPPGSCVLVGSGAPAFGGHGGPPQEWLAGKASGANCAGLQFLPLSDYVNQQPIGAAALLYGPRAGGGNAGVVAAALDRGPYPAPFTSMDLMYKSLDLLNFGDPAPLRAALVQLDGEIYASTRTVLLNDSVYLREAVLGRMRQAIFANGFGGLTLLGTGGPTLASAEPGASAQALPQFVSAYADASTPAFPILLGAPHPAAQDNVVWAQGIGAFGQIAATASAGGVDRNLAGFFAGIDHRFASNWIAGFASGYTNSSVSLGARSSSANINTGHVAAYGGGNLGAWNFIGAASASFNSLDTSRNIVFPGFSDAAGASTQAITSQLFGEMGYGVTFGRFAGEPFAGLAYVHLTTDPFAESGSTGAAALAAPGGSSDIGFSTLGLRLATDCGIGNGMIVTLHASAAWQHAIGPVTPAAALLFESNGAPFDVAGVPLARDAALVQAGFALHLTAQATVDIAYFGNLAPHAQDNSVKGNLNWSF